jgi:hypothetical protein
VGKLDYIRKFNMEQTSTREKVELIHKSALGRNYLSSRITFSFIPKLLRYSK